MSDRKMSLHRLLSPFERTKPNDAVTPTALIHEARNWLASGLGEPETLDPCARSAAALLTRAIHLLEKQNRVE